MKKFLSLLSFVVVLAACARVPAPGKVGQKLEYKGYAMTVTAFEEADDYSTTRKARAGYKLIAVEVLIESGGKNVTISPPHTRLVDGSKREYKARTTGKEPVLVETLDIPKGENKRGWMTYEVPEGTRVLAFVNTLPKEFNHAELVVKLRE
jgi:Domain of unknown function (DUF4352)